MAETFVLLHGSWHGGWAWEPTAWCLRELGHAAYTPTYPGHWPGANRAGITHDDYVRSVTDFIEQRDLRDVVLVGHSFGGSVVSRVSQVIPGRLKRLVFHTAFVVADGASVNDNFPPDQTAMFAQAAAQSPDNTVACDWQVFRDLFIQDARPQDARSVWERLVPQPFQPWEAKLDLAEFYRAGLPKSYIAVAEDRALPEGTWHPGMSSRLGPCKIVHMSGSPSRSPIRRTMPGPATGSEMSAATARPPVRSAKSESRPSSARSLTGYVDTLRVMLRHDRSWQLAAAELHIHKQTLGYRIRKIEQLTGRGLTSTEHLAEWWFALRAHDLLTARHPG